MQELAAHLKSVRLFQGVDPAYLDEIAAQCEVERFDPGATVFREGSAGDKLYIVLQGRVRVHKATEKGEIELAVLNPAACFGEMALFDGAPRSATAEAVEASEVLSLSAAALRTVCRRHPEIYENFLKIISRRLRQTDARLAG